MMLANAMGGNHFAICKHIKSMHYYTPYTILHVSSISAKLGGKDRFADSDLLPAVM